MGALADEGPVVQAVQEQQGALLVQLLQFMRIFAKPLDVDLLPVLHQFDRVLQTDCYGSLGVLVLAR